MLLANFNVPHYSFNLPWFMFDLSNKQIITSRTVPGDMSDTKDIFLTETPIPGLNYSPVQTGGNGNRKISFTLPLIKRNNTVGNSLMLQQFHALRNQAVGIKNIFSTQFNPNPKVLYYWGTGSVPLVYFVKKCDFTNKKQWTNQLGQPQYSEIAIELWLDERNILYKAEEVYRKLSIITQQAVVAVESVEGFGGRQF
jgi:hypothetical protein